MHQNAAISNIANTGMVICEPLKVVCRTHKQLSEANFETHIVGLSFVRFFLTSSRRTETDADIVQLIEEAD
jgi:hypothetical protein